MRMLSILHRYLSVSNNRASIGIGAMIVFIAMVLIAGIAASVLIDTSNTLEMQGSKTSQETEREVASGIRVYQIIGNYNTRNISGTFYSRFHNMSIMVTPCAGSEGIDLSETIVTIQNDTRMCVLSYASAFSSSASGSGVFSTANMFDLNASEFSVIVIEDDDNSCTSDAPIINDGDKALLNINLSASFKGFSGKEDVEGMVIIEDGAPGVFLFRTPGTSTKTVVEFM